MLKKIVDNLGFVGSLALAGGLIHYSIFKEWELANQIPVYAGLALLVIYLAAKFPVIVSALTSRGGRQGSLAGASLLLVLGILVLANFLNYRNHRRWDLSEGDLNSLSEQSLQVARTLKQDVQVAGFFENPAEAKSFSDAMNQYRFASSRISYQVYDPRKSRSEIEEYGIEADGQIVVSSGDKKQKIESVSEETLTNAIIKVTRDKEKVVCFLKGHGEHSLDDSQQDGYVAVKGALERQNYKVISCSLAVEGKPPEDVAVLISAGPKSNFLPNEVQALDEYLKAGGKFLLMVDPRVKFDMNDWLKNYGFQFDDNDVVDVSGLGSLLGLGAGAPVVSSYSNHKITEKLEVVSFFPLARSLSTVDSSLGYTTETLFSSSARSWGETDRASALSFDPTADKQGPLPLAIVSTLDHGDQSVAGEPDPETVSKESRLQTRIVAVGDSDFVSNRFLDAGGGHTDLFLNMVSWLVQDEDLIAVRPKDPTDRKVTLTATSGAILKWTSVVLLPIGILVLGISVWWRRR